MDVFDRIDSDYIDRHEYDASESEDYIINPAEEGSSNKRGKDTDWRILQHFNHP